MDAIEKRARELYAAQYQPGRSRDAARIADMSKPLSTLDYANQKAIRALISVLTPTDRPDPALLVSMAMRVNHGFGLMGRMAQNSLLADMSKVWEEVVGTGYYSPENASRYLRELARADANPEAS